MREILFRGKSKRDGNWIYGYLVKHEEYVIIDHSAGTLGFGQQVIPETIGQYTGMTDKNGTKIFEGDIVKYDIYPAYDLGQKIARLGEVIFSDGVFMPICYALTGSATVVGNIYEHSILKEACDQMARYGEEDV